MVTKVVQTFLLVLSLWLNALLQLRVLPLRHMDIFTNDAGRNGWIVGVQPHWWSREPGTLFSLNVVTATRVLYFVLHKYLSWIQFRRFAMHNWAIRCMFSLVYFIWLSCLNPIHWKKQNLNHLQWVFCLVIPLLCSLMIWTEKQYRFFTCVFPKKWLWSSL